MAGPREFFGSMAAKAVGLIGIGALLGACATPPGSSVQVGTGANRTNVDARGTTVRSGGDTYSIGTNGSWQITDRDRTGTTTVRQDANGRLCYGDNKGNVKLNLCSATPPRTAGKPMPTPPRGAEP